MLSRWQQQQAWQIRLLFSPPANQACNNQVGNGMNLVNSLTGNNIVVFHHQNIDHDYPSKSTNKINDNPGNCGATGHSLPAGTI